MSEGEGQFKAERKNFRLHFCVSLSFEGPTKESGQRLLSSTLLSWEAGCL